MIANSFAPATDIETALIRAIRDCGGRASTKQIVQKVTIVGQTQIFEYLRRMEAKGKVYRVTPRTGWFIHPD